MNGTWLLLHLFGWMSSYCHGHVKQSIDDLEEFITPNNEKMEEIYPWDHFSRNQLFVRKSPSYKKPFQIPEVRGISSRRGNYFPPAAHRAEEFSYYPLPNFRFYPDLDSVPPFPQPFLSATLQGNEREHHVQHDSPSYRADSKKPASLRKTKQTSVPNNLYGSGNFEVIPGGIYDFDETDDHFQYEPSKTQHGKTADLLSNFYDFEKTYRGSEY